MKRRLLVLSLAVVLVLWAGAFVAMNSPRVIAQGVASIVSVAGGAATGGAFGKAYSLPAYLKSKVVSANGGTLIKGGPGVVGCVVIATAGGSANVLTLYNAYANTTGYELATIDTTVKGEYCYGMIFSGALWAQMATGTAANVTITYR